MSTETKLPVIGSEETSVPPILPTQQILARFSVEDRKVLSRLVTEPTEFVYHVDFEKPGMGVALFGEDAETMTSPRPWLNSAAITAPADDSIEADSEQLLFMRLNYTRYRINRVLNGARARRLSADECAELVTWFQRSESLRVHLIQSNMPLVLAMAKRARLGNVDYAELISEGNMALLRSVDKFDFSRGFRFSTYGCRAILKSFSRVAIRTSRYRGRFPAEFDPTLERSDYIEQTRVELEEDCVTELKTILNKNAASLTDIEQRVLEERFALNKVAPAPGEVTDGKSGKTLEQVGQMIGVTKERVRQIQNKALGKLKAALDESILAA